MRRRHLGAFILLTALHGAGCGSDNTGGAGQACTWQSSASSGGLCQSDYGCSDGTHRGINCAGNDCVCSTDDRTTVRFSSPGFCALDREARYPIFASRCLATTADAGADASAD